MSMQAHSQRFLILLGFSLIVGCSPEVEEPVSKSPPSPLESRIRGLNKRIEALGQEREMLRSRVNVEKLFQFFAGYFHQDWDLDADRPEAVVGIYMEQVGAEAASSLAHAV